MKRPRPGRATAPAAEVLERRYRRLFACYPASYRAASEDEMLGVAMAGTKPGQRWPAPGEVRSLILGGAGMRLGGLLSGARTPAWRDAAGAFAFLAAALLAGVYAEALAGHLVPLMRGGLGRPVPSEFVLAAGWPLMAVAVALRWRWAAAVSASLGLAGAVDLLVTVHASDPSAVVLSWWRFILAITATLATIAWLASPRQASRVLPLWTVAAVVAAVAAIAASPLVTAAFTTVTVAPFHGSYVVYSELDGIEGYLRYGLIAVMAAGLLMGVARLGTAVRRRVLVMAIPTLAAWALVRWTFGGFLAASPRFAQPVQLTVPQWIALAAVPVLGLVIGMSWLGRHERMLRRLATQPADAH
jgi:hypothetical protein